MSVNGDRRRVALLVGGGVGPELVTPVLSVLEAAGADLEWQRVDVEAAAPNSDEDALAEAVDAVRDCGVGLKTKFLSGQPAVRPLGGVSNLNVELRQRLGLYAGVRPIRSLRGLPSRYPDLDLLLIRENTEDIYKGIEHEIVDGVVQSLKVVTRDACERIARFAFRIATDRGRSSVTFIHKGNIMKRADGLFLETVRGVAVEHPGIELREVIVDAACMQLVLDPYRFDVLLCGNLYGDILSSLCSGLAGGISLSYGINVGDDCRVYEAVHGDVPAELLGADRANPLPLLAPAVSLLRHFGWDDTADRIREAVSDVLEAGEAVTPDLGGQGTTTGMCEAIVGRL